MTFFNIYAILYFSQTHAALTTRYARLHELSLEPCENTRSPHAVICVSGFLNNRGDIERPWAVDFESPWTYGQIHCLRWETELLLKLGKTFNAIFAKAVEQAMSTAHFFFSLSNPVSLSGYLLGTVVAEFDNQMSVIANRAEQAGKQLANDLLTSALKDNLGVDLQPSDDEDATDVPPDQVLRKPRPVTLVGYSTGGSVILACLQELRRISTSVDARAALAADMVCDVAICGAPFSCTTEEWIALRRMVSGRFINGYLKTDTVLLEKQGRQSLTHGWTRFAGCNSLHAVPGIENVSMERFVTAHYQYATRMPVIIAHLFKNKNSK